MYIGAIPNTFCQLHSLSYLYITNNGLNSGITCAPLCVSSVANHVVRSTVCVYPQDIGLCGLIAATNIQSISGYSQWSCTTGGFTSTTPCLSPVWPGVTCSGTVVVGINFDLVGLTGAELRVLYVCPQYVCHVE